jgi:hypothetical protein
MDLDLLSALAALPRNAAFRVANERVPDGDYVFNTILPERNVNSYHVDAGSMTIRATMAGMVGMDSPYPPGGAVDISTFLEQTAKIANEIQLSEAVLRQMQELVLRLQAQGLPTVTEIQSNLLNFLDKVVVQPHIDRMEWLRGLALTTNGPIAWNFNDKTLDVNYGIPAGNFLPSRSIASNTAYGGTASKFWADVRELRRILRNSVRAIIVSGTTADVIRDNTYNGLVTVGETTSQGGRVRTITLRRLNPTNGQFSPDVGDSVTLVAYDGEGEVIDPADPKSTIVVPFMPDGKMLAIGNNVGRTFRIGAGSTNNPDEDQAIGYTHIAPTIEGGGRAGRWSQLRVPEDKPWMAIGRCVTNGLPVIQDEKKIAVATTEMP